MTPMTARAYEIKFGPSTKYTRMAETSSQVMVCHSSAVHRATVLRLKAQRGVDRHRQEEEQRAEDDLVFVDLVWLHIFCSRSI